MNILTREELKMLAGTFTAPCVSIFLPMHTAGADIQADPIRLKNLLRQAEDRLRGEGLREREIGGLLEPIYDLFENNRLFWRSPSRGLAIFRSPELFRYYRLPLQFDELAAINSRFYLKPLLPLFSGNGRFYMLMLCHDRPRLLEGTSTELHELHPEQMPSRLADLLAQETFQTLLQPPAGADATAEQRAAVLHGRPADHEIREELFRYFRRVDRELNALLRGEGVPLLLAGAGNLLSIYQDANTYPATIAEKITGTDTRSDGLHRRAWNAVEPYFRALMDKAMEQYNNVAGSGRSSARLADVVPAACNGRVDILFVDNAARLWGTYDPNASRVHVVSGEQPGVEELSDFTAVQTLLNGGMVYPLASNRVPDGAPMAALFRY